MNGSQAQKPVTMRDVAAAAGVNQSTVSRSLRGETSVSERVRTEVRRVAEELGYRPNPFVAAFTAQVRGYRRSPRRAAIALLNLHRADDQMPFLERYTNGAIARANSLGFGAEVFHYRQVNRDGARLVGILQHRGIRGLLIMPLPGYEDLSDLDVTHLACATINLAERTPRINHAVPDYFRNTQVALERLEALGYTRIGFCTKAAELTGFGRYALASYLVWQQKLPRSIRLAAHVDPALRSGSPMDRDALSQWLKRVRPDAVVSNDASFLRWMREFGIAVPAATAFASLNWETEQPRVAGVDQRQELVGAAAMDLVIGQIYRNEYGRPDSMKTVFIEGIWRDGATVTKRAPAAANADDGRMHQYARRRS
jgi:LacI family transcriptional regulator